MVCSWYEQLDEWWCPSQRWRRLEGVVRAETVEFSSSVIGISFLGHEMDRVLITSHPLSSKGTFTYKGA